VRARSLPKRGEKFIAAYFILPATSCAVAETKIPGTKNTKNLLGWWWSAVYLSGGTRRILSSDK
jgi:hypothetical protein